RARGPDQGGSGRTTASSTDRGKTTCRGERLAREISRDLGSELRASRQSPRRAAAAPRRIQARAQDQEAIAQVNHKERKHDDDDREGAGRSTERARSEGHAVVQGATGAGVQGVYGTAARAALAAGASGVVDAGVRDGCARRRQIPLALAQRP